MWDFWALPTTAVLSSAAALPNSLVHSRLSLSSHMEGADGVSVPQEGVGFHLHAWKCLSKLWHYSFQHLNSHSHGIYEKLTTLSSNAEGLIWTDGWWILWMNSSMRESWLIRQVGVLRCPDSSGAPQPNKVCATGPLLWSEWQGGNQAGVIRTRKVAEKCLWQSTEFLAFFMVCHGCVNIREVTSVTIKAFLRGLPEDLKDAADFRWIKTMEDTSFLWALHGDVTKTCFP